MEKGEITNKVAQSGLAAVDLELLAPVGERVLFDLKAFLYEELILKEKDFREMLKNHPWGDYQDKFVAVTCSADAIVPTWAYMLVAAKLQPYAKKIIFGDLKRLEEILFSEIISSINPAIYKDQRIVIKGCSKTDVPVSAYLELTAKLQPVAHSIMFGEPCSTVPVFKKK
jgi:hypothetical protein